MVVAISKSPQIVKSVRIFESFGPVFQKYVENRETFSDNYDWCFCKPPLHKYLAFF